MKLASSQVGREYQSAHDPAKYPGTSYLPTYLPTYVGTEVANLEVDRSGYIYIYPGILPTVCPFDCLVVCGRKLNLDN